jgi:hypothetical protein
MEELEEKESKERKKRKPRKLMGRDSVLTNSELKEN